jgi:signal transduction histidine kinase
MATLLKRSGASPESEAACRALRDAGLGVVEVDDWSQAARELESRDAAFVVLADRDGEAAEATKIAGALSGEEARTALSREAARSLSHDLRTPLSAMAGWVHLMETAKLDEAGMKRVIARLRGNIDDQVRTIEKYLGSTTQRGTDI